MRFYPFVLIETTEPQDRPKGDQDGWASPEYAPTKGVDTLLGMAPLRS